MNAAEYRKQALNNDLVYDLPLDTPRAIGKVRKFPIQQYLFAGKLPSYLAAQITASALGEEANFDTAKMSKEDFAESMEFLRKAICFVAVEPKISLQPLTEFEIGIEELPEKDFAIYRDWVLTGGESGADSFRSERYESFMAGTNGAELLKKTKRAGANK